MIGAAGRSAFPNDGAFPKELLVFSDNPEKHVAMMGIPTRVRNCGSDAPRTTRTRISCGRCTPCSSKRYCLLIPREWSIRTVRDADHRQSSVT
jgi:hypothetical protein